MIDSVNEESATGAELVSRLDAEVPADRHDLAAERGALLRTKRDPRTPRERMRVDADIRHFGSIDYDKLMKLLE